MKYEKVRTVFWSLSQNRTVSTKVLNSKLRQIVDLLTDNNNYAYRTMNLFLALSDKGNYYRRASMVSKLEAFPGQVDTISQDVNVAGGYSPADEMITETPEDEFILFSDSLHQAINKMFYSDKFVN